MGMVVVADEIDKVRDLDKSAPLREIDLTNIQFFELYRAKPIVLIGTVKSLNLPQQLTRSGRFGQVYEVKGDREGGKVVSIKLHQLEEQGYSAQGLKKIQVWSLSVPFFTINCQNEFRIRV